MPGLTSAQRKAALRRLRQEARRGCGPRLPVPQLAVALVADRIRVTFRNTGAVIRLHPAGSILPTAAIGCLMVLFVLASVSVRIIPQPGAAGSGGVPVNDGSGAGGSGPGAVPRATGPDPAGRAGSGASGMLSRTLVAWSPGSGAGPSPSQSPSRGASSPGDISVCVNIGPFGGCAGL
ncbi:MAG TPA: hypothetical protein VF482_18105 [Trebonia sp.]